MSVLGYPRIGVRLRAIAPKPPKPPAAGARERPGRSDASMAIRARRPRGDRVAGASLRAALLAEFLAFQSRVGADGVTVVLSEAASSTCAAAPSYRLSHFPRETSRHPAPHTGCCTRLHTLSHGWISAFTLLAPRDIYNNNSQFLT